MNNRNEYLSVIIPSYNNITLFKYALNSILNNSFKICEIIIIDDSTENDIEHYILSLNNKLIKYFHNRPSLGAVRNWNYGLSLTKGEYSILLHHDEYLINNVFFFENCLSKFKETNCDALILNSVVNFQDGSSRLQKIPNVIKKYIIRNVPSLLYSVNIIGPTSCVIFKKNIQVPFNVELNWLVDVDWYYRLLKGKKIIINEGIYIASNHGHTNQITNTIDIRNTEVKDQVIIRKNFVWYSSVSIALMIRNYLYFLKKILCIKNNPFWKSNENC